MILSLFLCSVLLLLLSELYLYGKRQTTRTQRTLAEAAELQLANQLIRNSIQKAGFSPCGNITNLITADLYNNKLHDLILPTTKHKALSVSRMSEEFYRVLDVINPAQLLTVGKPTQGSLILIADCDHAEVAKLQQVSINKGKGKTHNTILTLTKPLTFQYHSPFYWGEWIEEKFLINKNSAGLPALFYQREHLEELTPVITSLTVKQSAGKKNLVKIVLGLSDHKILMIVRVRNK